MWKALCRLCARVKLHCKSKCCEAELEINVNEPEKKSRSNSI